MRKLNAADQQFLDDFIEIRHGMEAMHQAVYGGLPSDDVDKRLEQFDRSLEVIRRRVPDELMDQHHKVTPPTLALAPDPAA